MTQDPCRDKYLTAATWQYMKSPIFQMSRPKRSLSDVEVLSNGMNITRILQHGFTSQTLLAGITGEALDHLGVQTQCSAWRL